MPTELSRTTARKRINIGASFVDVPVITKISFIDPNDRYQETQYTIDNSSGAMRKVHVDEIGATSPKLPVERIDRWTMLDPADRGQETQITMDNVTGNDSVPPHFTAHKTTHVVKYKNPDDANVWIKSELIDSFVVLDPNDRGQETVFVLNNPETDDEAQADPNDPDISDHGGDGNSDPAWRTDPFQNLIDVHGGGGMVAQHFVFRRWGDETVGGCAVTNQAIIQSGGDSTSGGDWYPVDAAWVHEKRLAGQVMPSFDRTLATRDYLSDLITACLTLSHQAGQLPAPPLITGQDGPGGRNPWWEWVDASSRSYCSCSNSSTGLPGQGEPPQFPVNQPSAGNGSGTAGVPIAIYTIEIGWALTDDVGTGGPTIPPGTPPWIPPT